MDSSIQKPTSTILCCECGTSIEPNPANMCVPCLRTRVDITEGIPKQATLYFCRNCERYLQPPAAWISATLESRELLSICIKKLKGLNKEVRLIDAGFIWTEPHSKRIKVKLTIQKEVMGGAVLQQVFVVEFTVNNQMCPDCHKVEAKDYWKAVVQVRQKVEHKKTFFYLEQLILKHNAHKDSVGIKQAHDGLDFFFSSKDNARKLVDFLLTVVPCRYQTSQKLISHDIHNNSYNYKFTFSVEIVPICKDSVVVLPGKLAKQLGNIGQVCVCTRITSNVNLIDPNTLQVADVTAPVFWRNQFNCVCSPKQLTEFIVLEVEQISQKDRKHTLSPVSSKHLLADVYVSKASELGLNDSQYHCRSHLGHLLHAGDSVLGFDFTHSNVNDRYLQAIPTDKVPDIVLVKKIFGNKENRIKKRKWKLKHLRKESGSDLSANGENDYHDFLDDLEEDPSFRQNVNIYLDKQKTAVDTDDITEDLSTKVTLAEMMDDLELG